METGSESATATSVTDPLDAFQLDPSEEVYEGFHGESEPTSAPAAPAPDAAPPSAPPTPAPAAPGDPAVPAPTEPAATATAPAPYMVRADGQDYAIRGATRTADGALVIPVESLPWVERAIQQGIAHQGSFHQRLETAKQKGYTEGVERGVTTHPDVIQAKAVLEEFDALLAGGPEKVAEFLDNFERSKSSLELKRAQALYDAKAPAAAATTTTPPAAPVRLEPQTAEAHLRTVVTTLAQQEPTLASLGDETIATALAAELAANPREYFYVAEDDDPAEDVKAGEIVCDVERVVAVLQQRARLLAHVTQQQAGLQTVKASNAERLQAAGLAPAPVPHAPPAVTAGPAGAVPRKLPQTEEEQDAFEALPLDEQLAIIAAHKRR
ncbi:MAG: hypothetical protein IT355_12060 [Gemmatimonadaceae bacterium]|nr:hypothetical protein [Gemmatimonadaceae bacterium]